MCWQACFQECLLLHWWYVLPAPSLNIYLSHGVHLVRDFLFVCLFVVRLPDVLVGLGIFSFLALAVLPLLIRIFSRQNVSGAHSFAFYLAFLQVYACGMRQLVKVNRCSGVGQRRGQQIHYHLPRLNIKKTRFLKKGVLLKK